MKNDNKYLKKMEIIIKARGGRHETYTSIFVDSSISSTLLDREEMVNIDSVQFVDSKSSDELWCCRKATVDDLIDELRRAKECFRSWCWW